MATKKNLTYNEDSIKVQQYPDNVRSNPTVYISSLGKEGNSHLLREVIDNSIDEFLNGFGKEITIEVSNKKGVFRVIDEGRGVPPKSIEKAFTTLHASGKFDKDSYSTSGGQHGLGSTCVNALSKYFLVITHADGYEYSQKFEYGRKVTELTKVGKSDKKGTIVEFAPDESVMEVNQIDLDSIKEECKMKSFINSGLTIVIKDLDEKKKSTYYHKDGLKEFVEINAPKALFNPITFATNSTVSKGNKELNVEIECSFTYNNTADSINIKSFCNSIYTSDGGTHETGFKMALTNLVKKYIADNNLLTKKDSNLEITGDAVQEGVVAVVSIKHPHPMYDQQSKKKLNSTEVSGAVMKAVNTEFSKWIETHVKEMKLICTKVIESAKANSAAKRAKELANKKSESGITAVSDLSKLANCISKKPEECELFIVEGNSASGTAKNGRDKNTQAVYALRGKILNTQNIAETKIFENKELSDLIYIITGKKTAIGKNFNIEDIKYHKIIALTDADEDGKHIATLLSGFIYGHARPIVENGYLYIAMPPLYSIIERNKKRYFLNQEEYDTYIEEKIFESYEFTHTTVKLTNSKVKTLLKNFETYKNKVSEMSIDNAINMYLIDDMCNYLRSNEDATNKDIVKFLKQIGDFEFFKNDEGNSEINGLYDNEFVNAVIKDLVKAAKKAKKILEDLNIPMDVFINDVPLTIKSYQDMYTKVTPKSRSRFKGLGEMDAEELWETTLDPSVRNIMQVVLSNEEKTDETMDTLLNSNSKFADRRKVFLMKNQQKIRELEI